MNKVDWSKLPEEANYVAKDNIGKWYWYETKPEYSMRRRFWYVSDESKYYGEIDPSLIYIYSQVEPKDSLISKEQTMTQNTPKPHRHSELIKMWADDQNLEFQWRMSDNGHWSTCSKPSFDEDLQYRLKPKEQEYIIINGVKVPKPETVPPKTYQTYFVPAFSKPEDYYCLVWYDSPHDKQYLENGMVHLNSGHAILQKQAIVAASTGKTT